MSCWQKKASEKSPESFFQGEKYAIIKEKEKEGKKMTGDIGIIGGADGPTAILVSDTGIFNVFGLILIVLIMIPNILYALFYKGKPRTQHIEKNSVFYKAMNILEQIGRYGCIFLMICNIGTAEPRFSSFGAVLVYLFGNAGLLLGYWVIWGLYFYRKSYPKQILLAVIPVGIFLLCGICLRHGFLILFGVLFGIGHIYITVKNRR